MKVRFFDPGKAYKQLKPEIDFEIRRVLSAGDLILRKDVEIFEENFAKFVGKRYAVGLNSGTDALYLALKVLGVGEGDKVATRSHTFVATVQVIAQLGATPILVDIDDRWPTKKIQHYIPVHISGLVDNPPDLPSEVITSVVEDSCQALGAQGLGYGDIQCWSFYPAKILGAYGDAGAITTDDEFFYQEIKELRNHYKVNYSKWGINSRLDNLQAAILNVKLSYVSQILARRQAIADYYLAQLKNFSFGLPPNQSGRVWQDFILQTPQRDNLYKYLTRYGIEVLKNEYPMPIKKLPKAAKFEQETLRLPINETLTDEQVEYVVRFLQQFDHLHALHNGSK